MIDWKHLRAQVMGKTDKPPLPPRLEVPKLPQTVSAVCERAERPDCTAADLCEVLEQESGNHRRPAQARELRSERAAHQGRDRSPGRGALGRQKYAVVRDHHGPRAADAEYEVAVDPGPFVLPGGVGARVFAREIAKATNRDTDLAFAGALIQDFILPSFTKQHVTEYASFMKQLSAGDAELPDLESAHFGCTHADCAAFLMLNWGFPDDLICCALLHHRPVQIWALEPLRHTALPALAATSWLPSVLAPSTAHLPKLAQYVSENFKLDIAVLAQSVDEQLRHQVPNLGTYVTLNQHLASAAVSV